MCVPKKLGNVAGPQRTDLPVESHCYPYPQSLVVRLPSWVRDRKTIQVKAQATFKDGVLSVSLHREPEEGTKIVGAFEIAFEPYGQKGSDLEVSVANPKGLALFDGSGFWVPQVVLPAEIVITVFLLNRRFDGNWKSDSPLVGLMFPDSHCRLASWRVALWRLIAYLDMVRGVS